MTALRRTMAVGLDEEHALSLDEARTLAEEGTLTARLIPLDTALEAYPSLTVTAGQATRFENGGALALDRLSSVPTTLTRVYTPDGRFLGLGRPDEGELRVARLFPTAER